MEPHRGEGATVNWAAATLGVSFAGCNTAMTCPSTSRVATVPAWQAVNTAAFTFTSAEVTGGGVQLVGAIMTMNVDLATPTQPEWVGGAPQGLDVAASPIRYDSASYVGRARGAVYPTIGSCLPWTSSRRTRTKARCTSCTLSSGHS